MPNRPQSHEIAPLVHALRLAICFALLFNADALRAEVIEIILESKPYRIELALSPAQRQRGLMHRPALARNEGMLLVYPGPGDHRIWMKNMLIPLRVYWLDNDFRVIGERRVEPCRADPCPVYSVGQESRYILELGDYPHPLAHGDRIVGIRIDDP